MHGNPETAAIWVTNGLTDALNNLVKRIKTIGFGFRNFGSYRIRALLYAGKPHWRVLGRVTWFAW